MEDFLNLLVTYGPYFGLTLGINAIVWGLKSKVFKSFFDGSIGQRLGWMLPMLFGLLGGLLLPGDDPIKSKLLTGLGLGAVSHIFYKFATKTLEKKVAEVDEKPVEDKGGGGDENLG